MDVARCIVCARTLDETEVRCCLPCLGEARRRLVSINRLYALLPEMIGRAAGAAPGTIAGSETRLPGGNALVMLAVGSPRGAGRPDDPPVVAQELASWCRDWCEARGEQALPQPRVEAMAAWLSLRCGWAAAHHDAFDEFAADLHRIDVALQVATDTLEVPVRGAPCFRCHALLERRWTDEGLDDIWRCPQCHQEYPPASYWLAVRALLESQAS